MRRNSKLQVENFIDMIGEMCGKDLTKEQHCMLIRYSTQTIFSNTNNCAVKLNWKKSRMNGKCIFVADFSKNKYTNKNKSNKNC